jgi:hypothetical protein
MGRLWTSIFTPLLALAVFLLGSPAAHAFGSEVLGCAFDSAAWTANSCEGGGDSSVYNTAIHFSPHNLSGTYTKRWTVTNQSGGAVPNCSSSITFNCISSGCTTTTVCDLLVHSNIQHTNTYYASLRLTQSGQTRTITASALVDLDGTICIQC